MTHSISATMGLDVGDRKSHYCVLDEDTGEILGEGAVATTRVGLRALLAELPRMRVVQETGGHSPWISVLAEECGHVEYRTRNTSSARRNLRLSHATSFLEEVACPTEIPRTTPARGGTSPTVD